ncbi:MAG TPA: nucleoside-diphosphate sugar epimerase/dehydratase [Pseudoflavonifractor sp.]|nr:nucleoside-diphosphate sugar epimerase/dehydratase [Pseudoflavonifractor sp.]
MGIRHYRKQIVFFADTMIFFGSSLFLYAFTGDLSHSTFASPLSLSFNFLFLWLCVLLFQFFFHSYDSLWRYAGSKEYFVLLLGAVPGFGLYIVISPLIFSIRLPSLYLIAAMSLTLVGMIMMRLLYRVYRNHMNRGNLTGRIPLAIIGAGDAGTLLLQELRLNSDSNYLPVCFFDDDREKIGRSILGVKVAGTIADLPNQLKNTPVRELMVAIPSASDSRRTEVLQICAQLDGVRVRILPSALTLLAHEDKPIATQLRDVRIEDLLGREPVQLDTALVSSFLYGKVILVTGGGGSIGSELCRQIFKHKPKKLIIVDIYENNAYDIQQELRQQYGNTPNLVVEIASVRDAQRINQLFDRYRPQVVFHAAAHKHVPLMEHSPQEAIQNNIFGTLNVVSAADRFGVSKFVQISTDKAVNPTNVMGATKRFCEMILQSMKGVSSTDFVAVRFGNVLGSNGSVVPLFKRQIAEGGPVTVTDKRIIRYFMTIPEAAQLVLQAGAMAHKNEVFVLDMGEPVKILTLAESLIRLSGYTPYQDIPIVETGLRPGEKLYEELLIISNNIQQTENKKIFIERQPAFSREEMVVKLAILQEAMKTGDPARLRTALHMVVPSFQEAELVNGQHDDGEKTILPQPQEYAQAVHAVV